MTAPPPSVNASEATSTGIPGRATERPWRLNPDDDPEITGTDIVDSAGRYVGYAEPVAKAALIVKAVNSHEELIAALEAQIWAHAGLCRAAGLSAQAHLNGTADARAVLARAKEGT